MNKINVIMLSPDLDVKGGISFVVQEYLNAGINDKTNFYFIPTHKDGPIYKKIIVFLSALAKIIALLPRIKGMIVHLHTSQNGSFFRKLILFCLVKLAGGKTIVHIHGSQFDIFMKKNFFIKNITRFYFDHADRIIVMSTSWLKIVSEFSYNKNINLVYNPVSVNNYQKTNRSDNINVLFMGRLGKRKGIYDLLDCIGNNKEFFQNNNIKFILAGDGEVAEVSRIVDSENLNKLVEVPGWIANEKKQSYLETADILILPSYNEQMPMSILEAMGYGCPIIATNIAGIPDMVENGINGYLFNPGDKEAMTEALKKLCSDADMRKNMGQKSREITQDKFENTKIVDQLVSIYLEVSST